MASVQFETQLTMMLPQLRKWAHRLTSNATSADDLAQDVVVKALQAHASFEPGTNFSAWLRRIMTNHFISECRVRRRHVDLREAPEAGASGNQEHLVWLKRLSVGFGQLPAEQRQALTWIALDERPYEDVAELAGVPIGTLKSRVHRARHVLRKQLDGKEAAA